MSIRVVIVEDDERIRSNLALLINQENGIVCVGTCNSGEEAISQIPALAPEVVLMDINLPGISGVECVRQLKEILPRVQVVMLTVYEDSEQIFAALEMGATGYLLKRMPPSEILEAIEQVHAGGAPMSGYIARKVVQSFQRRGPSPKETENLSKREEEILAHVAKGYINKEIADALSISVETVRSHLKSIYEKLHVRSRTAAAIKYFHE
jgi:DNA-binding NarL/FixJ family response regulator